MASLILNACDGLGGIASFSNNLGFAGVAGLPVLFVRVRMGLLAGVVLDFPGVEGGLRDGLMNDGWGVLDILKNKPTDGGKREFRYRAEGSSSSSM